MSDINMYAYGCLMWAQALSRVDESEIKQFTEDELSHFRNIVARLKRHSDFNQKEFEENSKTILKHVRSTFDRFCPLFHADEDGSWIIWNGDRDFEKEGEIINHFKYCVATHIIFSAEICMIDTDKIETIINIMLPKYTMDTIISKAIDFNRNNQPWRSEFEINNLFNTTYALTTKLSKKSFFSKSLSPDDYVNFIKDLKFVIGEMKFEGRLSDRMNADEVCYQILTQCGVYALGIVLESTDVNAKLIANSVMPFLDQWLREEPSSKPIVAQLYKDAF